MEMRSQDQVLIRQLMDLHAGIQELKRELSEEDEDRDEDEDEDRDEEEEGEESSSWVSCSETGTSSLSLSVSSGENELSASCLKLTTPHSSYWRASTVSRVSSRSSRRSSVP
ncbi:hypothetical protein CRUP_021416 [Coryphaenoides rupestris]|nr:hypothetical protein CRUP_021416 [Coryphaenoides rupestris]